MKNDLHDAEDHPDAAAAAGRLGLDDAAGPACASG